MQNVLDRVPDVLDRVPPDAWPMIDRMFDITIIAAAIWLALTIFVYWKRRAANLTPVTAARRSKKAQPEFLKVDHKARRAAIERGQAFERSLEQREEEEARAAALAALKPAARAGRVAKIAALITSVFTLIAMIFGTILNVGKMGELMQQYSTTQRLAAIIQNHPVGTTVAAVVIAAGLYQFFHERKARRAQEEF